MAFWTKGIAAGFFLPGIALWILAYQPHRWVMREPAVYLAIALPIVSLFTYYLLRNQLDPGYLQLVWENELGGRYTKPLEGHRGDALFYVRQLFWRPAEQPWGIVLLASLLVLSFQGKLNQDRHETVELVGLYWHFVDIVWVLIFTIVYLVV